MKDTAQLYDDFDGIDKDLTTLRKMRKHTRQDSRDLPNAILLSKKNPPVSLFHLTGSQLLYQTGKP